MHIAVNTRLLLQDKLEGIGNVAHQTLSRLTRIRPDIRFTFLFDRPFDERFIYHPNVKPVVLFPPARHPFLYVAWFEGSVASWLNRHRPDIFFSPDGYLSLRAAQSIRQIPLFHDLAFEHFPEGIDRLHRLHYQYFFPRYARKANHILTVSQATKDDIIQTYHIQPEKITVAPNGGGEAFHPLSETEKINIRNRYTAGKPYFLYVGAIHPRKNIPNLLKAFDRFKADSAFEPYKLVLAGRNAWQTGAVFQTLNQMKYKNDVIFTGYVPDSELPLLYGACEALCYVSILEGFGLPIVEAFRAGVPVLTSNISSMPEVVGEAGLQVSPFEVEQIAQGLRRLAAEPDLKTRLVTEGHRRSSLFTWEKTVQIVEKLLTDSKHMQITT